MNNFCKNKSKKLFFFLAFLVFFFFVCPLAKAFIASQVFLKEFDIQAAVFDAGDTIEGSFIVWNAESSVVPDIAYKLSLLAKDEEGNFTVVWNEQSGSVSFSLNPDQTITENFSYRLPKKIAPGEYDFRVRLYNSKGTGMARREIPINIEKTEGGVLNIQQASFIKDGEKKGTEFYYYPSEDPKISFEIINNSFFDVKARPEILIYEKTAEGLPVEKIEKDYLSLRPGEASVCEIDLKARFDSSFYVARAIMYDESKNPVSNLIDLKWEVVKEGAANIVEIETDKSSYFAGDEAKVSVAVNSQGEDYQGGEITVKIIDGDQTIGQTVQDVDLNAGRIDVLVPVKKGVSDPKIETTIVGSQNEFLDDYRIEIKDRKEKSPEKEPVDWLLVCGFAFVILAVIVAAVLLFLKKKGNKPAELAAVFIVAGLLLGLGAQAGTWGSKGQWEESFGNQDIMIFPSEPLPSSILYLDGWATFSGNIDSYYFDRKESGFEFFITNAKEDVILTTESIQGQKIQVIDLEATRRRGDKIESLGTSPMNFGGGYKISLQIPNDQSYLGPDTRFYVQFKGLKRTWLGTSWDSAVIYLKTIVQTAKEGGFYLDIKAEEAVSSGEIASGSTVSSGENIKYTINVSNDSPCATIAQPTDIVLILDRSGSMAYGLDNNEKVSYSMSRMAAAKSAVESFLDILKPERDRAALVSYSSGSAIDVHLTNEDGYGEIKRALGNLNVLGGTCISCGIDQAKKEIKYNGEDRNKKYAILLTDGGANISLSGSGSPSLDCYGPSAQDSVRQAEDNPENIVFYSVGFSKMAAGVPPSPTTTASGINNYCYNPPTIGYPNSCCGLMNIIADKGKGTYSYATDEAELVKIYQAIAGAIAGQSKGTKLMVDIPQEFSLTKIDDRCSFDERARVLTCPNLGDNGFLDCNNKTKIDPIEFEVQVEDNVVGEIEIKASVSNQINQEKNIIFKLTVSNIRLDAGFSCDSSACGIGCSSCCRCYNDSFGVLQLKNESTPKADIIESVWSIAPLGSGSYVEKLRSASVENYTPQKISAGTYTVKLKVSSTKSSDETTKQIVFLQGVKAGFSCSLDEGATWYACNDIDHIHPDQGATIWLSDVRGPERSILSDGADPSKTERRWYKVDEKGDKRIFSSGTGNSTVHIALDRLPAIIGMDLDDKNRPVDYKEHKINVIALPGWVESSPF